MKEEKYTTAHQAEIAYKILADVSNLDVKLMWNRVSVLVVFIGALLAFVASNIGKTNFFLLLLMCIIGFFISILLYYVTKGGSFWVTHWETKMQEIEPLLFDKEINIYRKHPTNSNKEEKEHFRKQGYISTRKTLITITLCSCLIWPILILYIFVQTI